jgi:hypothetical protein
MIVKDKKVKKYLTEELTNIFIGYYGETGMDVDEILIKRDEFIKEFIKKMEE